MGLVCFLEAKPDGGDSAGLQEVDVHLAKWHVRQRQPCLSVP